MKISELFIAFSGGILTFFTPCVLPLIPTYLVYLTGLTISDIAEGKKLLTIKHSLFFILGFSTVFIILGLSITAIGGIFFENKDIIKKIGGLILVLLGVIIVSGVKPQFLMKDTRPSIATKPVGYFGSFLVGAAFSSGWSPCVGPALIMIFSLTASRENLTKGFILLTLFSAGLAIPFLFASFFIEYFTKFLTKFKKHLSQIEIIFGVFLFLIGILMIFNKI